MARTKGSKNRPEAHDRVVQGQLRRNADPAKRSTFAATRTPEARARARESQRAWWANPANREAHRQRCQAAWASEERRELRRQLRAEQVERQQSWRVPPQHLPWWRNMLRSGKTPTQARAAIEERMRRAGEAA